MLFRLILLLKSSWGCQGEEHYSEYVMGTILPGETLIWKHTTEMLTFAGRCFCLVSCPWALKDSNTSLFLLIQQFSLLVDAKIILIELFLSYDSLCAPFHITLLLFWIFVSLCNFFWFLSLYLISLLKLYPFYFVCHFLFFYLWVFTFLMPIKISIMLYIFLILTGPSPKLTKILPFHMDHSAREPFLISSILTD